mgnify:CR=1 FL=1
MRENKTSRINHRNRIFLLVLACSFLAISSCKDDLDDNLFYEGLPDNQFIADDGNVYATGVSGCSNGDYMVDNTKIVTGLSIPNNLPESFDLSEYLPPIGNQGRQGSCVSWATTYYLKSFQERIESGLPFSDSRIMSPAYTYNQVTQGTCSGTTFESTLDILKQQGVISLFEFPYSDSSCSLQPNEFQINSAAANKISNYKYLSGLNMVNEMKTLLINQQPILISAFLTKQFGKKDALGLTAYRAHTINPRMVGDCHAMLVVGYSDEYNAFKVVNSWGESWGDAGFVWIDYNAFEDVLNQNKAFKVINQAIVVEDL